MRTAKEKSAAAEKALLESKVHLQQQEPDRCSCPLFTLSGFEINPVHVHILFNIPSASLPQECGLPLMPRAPQCPGLVLFETPHEVDWQPSMNHAPRQRH